MKRVMVFGTFDVLHPGHISYLKQAKKYGDELIVVIARDETVKKIKGRLPQNSEKDRKGLISQLKLVDIAVLGDKKDHMKVVRKLKPNVAGIGYDQNNFIDKLKKEFPEIKVVRLKPYKPNYYKSSKLK